MSLADKRIKEYTIDNYTGNFVYPEEHIKEFIEELKKYIIKDKKILSASKVFEEINKLAGEKLLK